MHLAGEDRRRRAFFAVEHSRRARETQAFLAGDFRDRTFRREAAVHHDEVTVFLDRLRQRANDVLPRGIVRDVTQIFGERTARHGERITVQQFRVEHAFHQWLDSANRNKLGH